jgi:hypothetical protein
MFEYLIALYYFSWIEIPVFQISLACLIKRIPHIKPVQLYVSLIPMVQMGQLKGPLTWGLWGPLFITLSHYPLYPKISDHHVLQGAN